MKTGICGQLKGPFYAGQNLTNRIADGGAGFLRLGISLDEKDLMQFEKTGFYFKYLTLSSLKEYLYASFSSSVYRENHSYVFKLCV